MGRGDEQIGDVLAVSAVDDSGRKTYPLAPLPNNTSYNTISLQPEAQPNQPVSVPISFHGGLAFDHYDEQTGGCLVNTGVLSNERNVLRAPVKVNTTTLTGAQAPVMYFFEAFTPDLTPTYDAKSKGLIENAKTVTISHTVADQTNRLLIVMIAVDGTVFGAINTVTYNGDSLIPYAAYGVPTDRGLYCFYMVDPNVGTANIIVTLSDNCDAVVIASSYYNIDQARPLGTFTAATATSDAPSVAVPCASGDEVVDIVSAGNVTATKDASQDAIDDDLADTTIRGGSSRETSTGASVTMSWALSASSEWAIGAVPILGGTKPVLYANSVEDGEVNAYKVSLDDANFGDLLATKTWSLVTTKPMGRPAEWTSGGNTYWRQPLGDNGLIDSLTSVASGANDPTTETNDTWSGGTSAAARHLTVVKNQLYRTSTDLADTPKGNEVCILDRNQDPEGAAWGGAWYVGDAGIPITDIGSVAGFADIPKEDGIWWFDGVAEPNNILPELGLAERNGQGLSFGRGGWFYPGATSLYWSLTGQPIGPDSPSDEHVANDPSIGEGQYFKYGRWNGTVSYNGHFYGIYVNSTGTSAFVVWAYPVGERWRWQVIASVTADLTDFHGIHVAEMSKFSASEVRPCLFFANGNDLSYIWLDRSGGPMLKRGDIDLHTSATAISGRIDFGFPRVPKQLSYISGWAEDFAATADYHQMQLKVYRDGGSAENVGTDITGTGSSPDGYFTKWWTQDTNDECRSLLFESEWTGTNSLTDQDGPLLRDVQIHAILKPATTRLWSFLISASDKDNPARTAKTIRSDLEGYLNDLKKFKFPHEDAFSGMLTGLELLRANEINELTPRGQAPPKYVFRALVREMPSA